jgi:catechol 2,3-dioxygenase-like lactoylglutathione lyase family enzyme
MKLEPTVQGIVESALYVQDLNRSKQFYERVFGFETILEDASRMIAMAAGGKQVLLLFLRGATSDPLRTPGGVIPPHGAHGEQHIAFAISADQLEAWQQKLEEVGVVVESRVECGGSSIYFRDPDNHILELITPGCWKVY